MKQKKISTQIKKNTPFFLIALPGIAYLIINNYIPMFGVFLAFKDYNYVDGVFKSPWNGLENFKFLFATKDAFIMTRNTVLYNLAFIVIGTVLAIAIAIMMCALGEGLRVKFFQSALLLPNLLSWVVIGFMCFAFLNSDTGFINNTVLKLLGQEGIGWYSTPKYWPAILIVVNLWKTLGYSSIIYMASISGIDKSIYEAAKVDGASQWKQIWCITLPMLKPTVTVLTLMSVGKMFYSDFGLFYQVPMNSGALFDVTQTIDTYVYRALMQMNDVGMSAAAALYQSVVGFVLVMLANGIVRKVDNENALF
ncbi:MAG: ABC transporter permease subunit [Ruthenibacterium sp.]